MSCRSGAGPFTPLGSRGFTLASSVLFTALAAASPAAAQSCERLARDLHGDRTEVIRDARLERIDARDLLTDPRRARRMRHRSELDRGFEPVRHVVRRVPRLWRKRIPAGVPLHALRIEHRVGSAGLDNATAVQRRDVSLDLPVIVRPTRPVVVCRGAGFQIVEGGVMVEFPISRLPAGGRYHLDIETDVRLP